MKKFLLSLIPPALVTLILREPAVVISGLVAAAAEVATQVFHHHLTSVEQMAVHAGAAIVLSLITRALVTPTASLPSGGISAPSAAPVAPIPPAPPSIVISTAGGVTTAGTTSSTGPTDPSQPAPTPGA